MWVAALSDIHGHLPALEAVLAEVDQAGVDRVVLTGDIAAGPMPVPTLQRLLSLGGYPDIEPWLDFFVRQTVGDDEALAVFGPRDGRRHRPP